MSQTSSIRALLIFCLWSVLGLMSTNAYAQTSQIADKQLEQYILKDANENPASLIKKQLLIDWKKYRIKELLKLSWLSAKDLSPIHLGLSEETIAFLTEQFKAQKSGEWEASFLSRINQKSKPSQRYAMSVPVLSQDHKLAFIAYGHEDGEVLILMRKYQGKWKRFAMLQLWGA